MAGNATAASLDRVLRFLPEGADWLDVDVQGAELGIFNAATELGAARLLRSTRQAPLPDDAPRQEVHGTRNTPITWIHGRNRAQRLQRRRSSKTPSRAYTRKYAMPFLNPSRVYSNERVRGW